MVTGLDAWPEMLRFARRRLPRAPLVLADARQFRLKPVFNAVVSTFDSVNHVLTLKELARVFRNVRDSLTPAGVFVFDLNTEESYRTLWAKSSVSVRPDHVCVVRGGYDARARIGRTEITLLARDASGAWRRSEVRLRQR